MDTAETIYISSLALLKMLKHGPYPLCTDSRLVHLNSCFWQGRAGVPMEVMGLMVGEFVDDYMVVVGSILPLAVWC